MYGFDSSMEDVAAESRREYDLQDQRDLQAAQAERNDPRNRMPLEPVSLRPPRPILSWALVITLPLAAIVLFFPHNGKNVEIPVGVHQFLAVMVASIGSPLMRRFVIGLMVIIGVLLLVGTLIAHH